MSSSVEDSGISGQGSLPLSRVDRELIFKIATCGLVHHYGDQLASGMTDYDLKHALKNVLGIFGGSGGPGTPSVSYQGNGLKIWGAWEVINHVTTAPLFSGQATVYMAREVYGIADPTKDQMSLF